jgi:hypothetical protein
VPNTDLKPSKIDEWVRRKLGNSAVEVELKTEDMRQCLKQTISIYNRNRPQRAHAVLSANSTQKRYEISHPGLQGVVRVEFVRNSVVRGTVDPFDPYSTHRVPFTTRSGITFGEYAQQQSYQEDSRRIVSSEPEWHGEWDRDDNKYYLYVDITPGVGYDVSYEYTWHVDDEKWGDDEPTGLNWIPDSDVDWVRAHTLACAKTILGRIRGKFHGVPMPDGSDEENDYAELIQEGREDMEKLKEEIESRRRPLIPLIE